MFDLSGYHLILAGLGVAIVLAYWLPRLVSGREPAASALLIGLGAGLFGWIPDLPASLNPVTSPKPWEVVSELCVIFGLFGVGLRIDRLAPLAQWGPSARLLAIAMPLTILAVAGLGWWWAGLPMVAALLLGSVLAPTDPVLAGDVQVGRPTEGGEHPVRYTLTAEAGLNDGLAFPFVHLSLALAAAAMPLGELMGEWAWRDVGYRIVVGAACGVGVGWLLGKVLFDVPRENALAKTEAGVFALAGVLTAYGLTELAEGYGFIAAFAAGLTLRRSESHHAFHVRLHNFSETIEHALTAVLLIGLGAALPAILPALTWTGAAVGLALVLLVRPLSGWVSLAGTRLSGRERAVVAAYGVRGVGSIYYLAYAGSHAALPGEAELWAIVAFTILVSTVLHGFSAALAVERATGEPQSG
ncbi:cation:proton antiporter [Phenylobacterium kunshanense]|uniref:Sodium:proton antiporter n=1 Tax=Phenylobacterium kunshanense TaxID=1445034 RepID=A0A328B967_9CAUL|nr:cation:proton antiporter [Phenylobacterium kunshanense]RAK62456.1 sodium:proton antiporter [Phenylobacterium kunshanense]